MILNQGKLHWFSDVFIIGDKLYSNTIHQECEIKVAFNSTIKILPAYRWEDKMWKEKILSADITIDSAFLHKRHVVSGYSHIIGDECFPMFYMLEKNKINIDGILSLNNLQRKSPLVENWSNWIRSFTPYDIIHENYVKEGVANIFIKNAYCGWQTNSWTKRDKNFDFKSYPNSIRKRMNVSDSYNPKKIIFEVRSGDRRNILNLEDIKKSFTDLDVEFVDMASLSFKEQIEKVFNAGIFIAQHGAGLTNSIFMRQEAKVIELLPETYSDYDAYQMFVSMFGGNYIKHIEPKENCREKDIKDAKAKNRDQDLIIDTEKLKAKILR